MASSGKVGCVWTTLEESCYLYRDTLTLLGLFFFIWIPPSACGVPLAVKFMFVFAITVGLRMLLLFSLTYFDTATAGENINICGVNDDRSSIFSSCIYTC